MKQNPYSWNLRANVLYIENPAGVGFSIAGTDDDWLHSDYSTSLDLIEALKDFYTKFPTLVNNDLYVSGESYAGIYVPYLTWQIYNWNIQQRAKKKPEIPLKGMMVGNGVTDYTYDVWPAYIPTVYNFNLIPTSLKNQVLKNNCTHSFRHVLEENLTAECNATW